MKENNILIIDKCNSRISHSLYKDISALNNCHVQVSNKGALPRGSYDIVLPITTLSRPFSEKFFKQLSEKYKESKIVPVLSENNSNQMNHFRPDLDEFVIYPHSKTHVLEQVECILKDTKYNEKQQAITSLQEKFFLKKLVGKNPSFLELINKIPVVAKSDVNVLIQGETGTGKELVARAIHYLSHRRTGPFNAINAATLPPLLFENEMFGHDKEAFTDAKSFRSGIIREAEGGTIFLDEIDTLERPSQSKLLRFIEEKRYKPLGSESFINADVRIVTASNANLMKMMNEACFGPDLYYRLSVITLTLPPLRKRKEDIPILIEHFIKKYESRFGSKSFSQDAIEMLSLHNWPGNIRELENLVQKSIIMTPGKVIEPRSISFNTEHSQRKSFPTFQEAKKVMINEFEKDYLSTMLKLNNGNITHAAKAAGKDRRSFGRLVTKHRLLDSENTPANSKQIKPI